MARLEPAFEEVRRQDGARRGPIWALHLDCVASTPAVALRRLGHAALCDVARTPPAIFGVVARLLCARHHERTRAAVGRCRRGSSEQQRKACAEHARDSPPVVQYVSMMKRPAQWFVALQSCRLLL
eukprot:4088476-Prymnesium_polylepis.1